jgi:hypothetical protein
MRIIILLAAVLLAGCQTVEPPATASGKPEVTINAPIAKIKSILISNAVNAGFSISKDTEYLLQFDKPSNNFAAQLLLGSKYDGVPNERYQITFAQMGESVRVVAAGMIVTNPGSSFERVMPINAGDGINKTQEELLTVKDVAETPTSPPAAQAPLRRKPSSPSAKPVG